MIPRRGRSVKVPIPTESPVRAPGSRRGSGIRQDIPSLSLECTVPSFSYYMSNESDLTPKPRSYNDLEQLDKPAVVKEELKQEDKDTLMARVR